MQFRGALSNRRWAQRYFCLAGVAQTSRAPSSLAREALLKQLRDYQDWTGVRVVVVFDGKGKKVEATSDPAEVQVFYSRSGQSADAVIERLASKYAKRFELMVATSDSMEAETVHGMRRRTDFLRSVA